mmetsp:Transcript_15291/g.37578  ORF Transcript_15291/g.37578 Transcript_15291/m.37578 type:complete len:369 (-) Transcript_15291:2880-3986(-)
MKAVSLAASASSLALSSAVSFSAAILAASATAAAFFSTARLAASAVSLALTLAASFSASSAAFFSAVSFSMASSAISLAVVSPTKAMRSFESWSMPLGLPLIPNGEPLCLSPASMLMPLGPPFTPENGDVDCFGAVNDVMPFLAAALNVVIPFLANGEADTESLGFAVFGTNELLAGALLVTESSSLDSSFNSSPESLLRPLGLPFMAGNGDVDCFGAVNDVMPFLAAALNVVIPFLANGEADAVFGTNELLAGALLATESSSSDSSFKSSPASLLKPLGLPVIPGNGDVDCFGVVNDAMPFLVSALNDAIPFLAKGEADAVFGTNELLAGALLVTESSSLDSSFNSSPASLLMPLGPPFMPENGDVD